MINRIFLTALFVVGTFLTSFADEQKKINLNNDDHTTETIELAFCNIFVTLKNVDDNDNAEVAIELENIHESNTLLLFERAYDEKTLKKMSPSITYDKVFGGSKGMRYIDACSDIKPTTRILPSAKKTLFAKTGSTSLPIACKLPIYIAKNKNKTGSKMVLLAKEVIEIEVNVQSKPDEVFISVENECNYLLEEIKDLNFCEYKSHKETKTIKNINTRDNFQSKIDNLKKRIKETIESRGYYPSDKAYKKFMEVYSRIDSISLENKTIVKCKRCPPIPHHDCCPRRNCAYCSLSSDAIYNKMQNYYIAIHNGKNTKKQVLSEVEGLYTCLTKCTKRKKNDSKRSRAIEYYNKIKSL